MVIKNSEQYFYACDGAILKSAKEMLEWMKSSSDESFSHHINSEKNDFTGWVKEVLKDSVLAKKISKVETRDEMIEALEDRLALKNKDKSKKKTIISQIKEAIMNE